MSGFSPHNHRTFCLFCAPLQFSLCSSKPSTKWKVAWHPPHTKMSIFSSSCWAPVVRVSGNEIEGLERNMCDLQVLTLYHVRMLAEVVWPNLVGHDRVSVKGYSVFS